MIVKIDCFWFLKIVPLDFQVSLKFHVKSAQEILVELSFEKLKP